MTAKYRAVTADEKRAWIAREADRDPDVIEAAGRYRSAVVAAETARDEVALCERRLQAVRYDLTAATQLLATLTTGLT